MTSSALIKVGSRCFAVPLKKIHLVRIQGTDKLICTTYQKETDGNNNHSQPEPIMSNGMLNHDSAHKFLRLWENRDTENMGRD
jgi:hypothetical protein